MSAEGTQRGPRHLPSPGAADDLTAALSRLPDAEGGLVVIMATASVPPALVVLSTGDVVVADDEVRVGLLAGSSALDRLGGAFSLLVPAGRSCLRVEVEDAAAERHGDVAIVRGRLVDIRPTAEPPWVVEMAFRPEGADPAVVDRHVEYWRAVREWLVGERSQPPSLHQEGSA